MPKAIMAVGHQFAFPRKLLQRRPFESKVRIIVQVIEDTPIEHKKAAIDPTAGLDRFLREFEHAVAVELQLAEATRRLH
jgi:hypothetical protein